MLTVIKKITEFNAHSASVYKLIPGLDSHLFFSVSADKYIVQWDLKTLQQTPLTIKLERPAYTILFNKETSLLFCGTLSGNVVVIDVLNKKEIQNLKPSSSAIYSLYANKILNVFLCGDAKGWIYVYALDTFQFLEKIQISTSKIRQIIYTKTGFWAACTDNPLVHFNINPFAFIQSVNAHAMGANFIWIDKNRALTGSRDALLKEWKIENNYWHLNKRIPLHNYAIYALEQSSNGDLLATAGRDKTIKILEKTTLKVLSRIDLKENQGHTLSVNTIFWSNYNNYLISAGDDKKIMVWKVQRISPL
ncbi:MAG: hypothetical protein IT239_01355 [Bacteroidia bacterium]|nr:hypothetical protein [Bacteroidia bacterium]